MATDTPTISLGNPPLKIYAQRSGTRVTGRVVFPHESNGRTECSIDYQSKRPDGSTDGGEPSKADRRQTMRIEAVKRHKDLRADRPTAPKTRIARQVVTEFTDRIRISVRSLQTWIAKLGLEGEDGLRDRYTKPPKRVPTLDASQATDAVKVCAWWSYRTGNCGVIDTKMLHAACGLLSIGYPVADILAVIECYFGYSCDRGRYPFLPFARWAKHHFDKWLHRAIEDADHRRGLDASRAISPPPTIADAKSRRRDVLFKPTRRAIGEMAPASPEPVSTADRTPVEPSSKPLQDAATLKHFGFDRLAKEAVAKAAPGIPAALINTDPRTPAEALATLDDKFRVMLLDAAHGDREAREQAIATLPMWWDHMPAAYREELGRAAEDWVQGFLGQHLSGRSADKDSEIARAIATPDETITRALATQKVKSLLPHLLPKRSGIQRLGLARRLTG